MVCHARSGTLGVWLWLCEPIDKAKKPVHLKWSGSTLPRAQWQNPTSPPPPALSNPPVDRVYGSGVLVGSGGSSFGITPPSPSGPLPRRSGESLRAQFKRVTSSTFSQGRERRRLCFAVLQFFRWRCAFCILRTNRGKPGINKQRSDLTDRNGVLLFYGIGNIFRFTFNF